MQIIFLEPTETYILDIVAWIIFHLGIGYSSTKIPLIKLDPDHMFFKTATWEKEGMIYDQVFHIRSWKRFIPDGSLLYKGTFSIKNITKMDITYLQRWICESIRSEICHWAMIVPGFFFFLWNTFQIGWLMVLYAIVNNLVPIILQRYNRPRIRKLLEYLELKKFFKVESRVEQFQQGVRQVKEA
jgi:glycosyl-4,4'-diaponeurosporenoate acyltransferase